jgi:hypothetical protein
MDGGEDCRDRERNVVVLIVLTPEGATVCRGVGKLLQLDGSNKKQTQTTTFVNSVAAVAETDTEKIRMVIEIRSMEL